MPRKEKNLGGGRGGAVVGFWSCALSFPIVGIYCIMINNQPPLMMVVELMMNRKGGKMVEDRDHLPSDKSYCSSAQDYNFTPGSPF